MSRRRGGKGAVRVPRPVSVPMLINRGLRNDELELRERMFVDAFAGGWATTEHFDSLADLRDVLLLAAALKKDADAIGMCRLAGVALMNIRDRFAATGRMGVAGDELVALRLFATAYRDFWMRQPVSTYEVACELLTRARELKEIEVEVAG